MNNYDFFVSIHPYIHSPTSKNTIFLNKFFALALLFIIAFYQYGLKVILSFIVSTICFILPTYINLKRKGKRLADLDYEYYYYAILFLLILPSSLSYFQIAISAIIFNFLMFWPNNMSLLRIINPIAGIYCLMYVMLNEKIYFFDKPKQFLSMQWFNPFHISDNLVPNLFYMNYYGELSHTKDNIINIIKQLFVFHYGHYGEIFLIAILISFTFLVYKQCVELYSFFGSIIGLILGISVIYFKSGVLSILISIINYAFLTPFFFYICFVVTDYYSLPQNIISRLAFGIGFGVLFTILTYFYPYLNCSAFALVIISIFTPLMDEIVDVIKYGK